jgi:putative drug exporter of the RND superfamily
MLAVPIPFLRSLGVAGLVVPVCALAASLSLAPALASLVRARSMPTHRRAGQFWPRFSRGVVARPSVVLAGSIALLALLSAPLVGLSLTAGSLRAVPAGLASTRALALIESHVGVGVVAPVQIVIDAGDANVNDPAIRAARDALAGRVLAMANVAVVAEGEKPPYVDASRRYERVIVVTQADFASPATSTLVAEIRAAVAGAHFPTGVSVSVGGAPAQARDFVSRVGSSLPLVIAGALLLAGAILWLAFSSLPIALLAVVLDLASVAGALGVLTAVFRYGLFAGVLGTYRVDAIESWVPVFLFAVLFGLSMDYEVFVVGAVREARRRGLGPRTAVEDALSATGPVVTGAAGVMVAALVGLVIGRVAGLQELGVGLAAGVGIDALVVRALVLPSVLALLGERAW